MLKKIFITNGSGGCGKDTFAKAISELIPTYKYSAIDAVKRCAKDVGWNGEKSEKDRKFLSDLKELTSSYNDFSFKDISKIVEDFKNNKLDSIVLLIDIREPKDIQRAKEEFGAETILIRRSSVKPILSNMADANVENYGYDYYIDNNGTLDDLERTAYEFVKEVIIGDCGKSQIDDLCIDCMQIGVDEQGKYCPITRGILDKSSVLADIAKAVEGYKETDMVPISGGLLYNIARILKEQV